jgi:hypothetical protein
MQDLFPEETSNQKDDHRREETQHVGISVKEGFKLLD